MIERTPEQEKEREAQLRTLKLRWWVAENFRRACMSPANPDAEPLTDEYLVSRAVDEREHNVRRWIHEGIAPHADRLAKVAAWVMERILEAPPGETLPADLRKRRRR